MEYLILLIILSLIIRTTCTDVNIITLELQYNIGAYEVWFESWLRGMMKVYVEYLMLVLCERLYDDMYYEEPLL